VDRGSEEVDPDEREVALGVGRLLLQPDHPAAGVELGDAELLGIADLGEHDVGRGPFLGEPVHDVVDAADDEVVSEIHDEVVVAEVVAGDQHGVGEPQRGLLADVGDLQAEREAVADGRLDLGMRVAHDDPDLPDPGGGDGLEPVEEHGLVGDGDELFRRGMGDRSQPSARPSGEHECFHG
jgi:hypothetical protein